MREIEMLGYRVLVGKDYDEMSEIAAYFMVSQMAQQKRMNIAITAGKTPKGVYEKLAPLVKGNFKNVHYFNFDEIPNPLGEYDVTIGNLRRDFLKPAGIEEERIHPLTLDNYTTQDERIKAMGGLDVMMLGLGWDGHFCGNLPHTTKLNDWTTRVDMTLEQTIGLMKAEGCEIPEKIDRTYYVTMGPRSVLHTKKIVMIVNGEHKAEILKRILTEEISMDCPSTFFQLHPDVTLIIDEDAASQLEI